MFTCPFTLFLVMLSTLSFAQNLLKNPSFELHGSVPCDNLASMTKQFSPCENWQHSWAAELYDTKIIEKCKLYKKEVNEAAFLPHTGNTMLGQSSSMIGTVHKDTIAEYLYTQLSKPLKKGTVYHTSYWFATKQNGVFNIPLGCLLTKENLFAKQKNLHIIRQTPQISFAPDSLVEQSKWYEVKGYFEATGDEKYIYFGCFLFQPIKHFENRIDYTFIDDVLLREATDEETNSYKQKNTFISSKIYIFDNLQYDKNEVMPTKNSYQSLDSLYNFMVKQPTMKLQITAHTDNTNTTLYNKKLAEQRATWIANYLITKGINKNNITAKGLGETQPKVPNTNEKNRAINRRIEFVLQ